VRPRILLVDDNEDFLDSTKDVIEDEGYEVFTAISGEEAVGEVESRAFDVVIMDIKMPGMNGVEAFIEMKKHSPNIKVIFCTAYIVESTIRQALREGAQAVLNKPFEMDDLLDTIEKILEGRPRCKILIADRDEHFCDRLSHLLSAHGYDAVAALFGPEAITKAVESDFDVLVLDHGLPLLDGIEVYRKIKSLQPNITAVITGNVREMNSKTFKDFKRQSGIVSVKKPIDENQLIDLLQQLCMIEHGNNHSMERSRS
jgi:two-component system response regulator HydG